jgi:hypothetical protein
LATAGSPLTAEAGRSDRQGADGLRSVYLQRVASFLAVRLFELAALKVVQTKTARALQIMS